MAGAVSPPTSDRVAEPFPAAAAVRDHSTVHHPGPGASAARPRTQTAAEVVTLRKLYQGANLFDGGHIGADYSVSDLPFYILIVRSYPPNRAVVLVLTGNPTFSSGPRKALFDWLLRERQGPTR
jgi:hypothetical protein